MPDGGAPVHPRLLLRRRRWRPARPSLYWTAAIGLAVATALVISSLVSRAESARRRWGDFRPVAVARHTLRPGDVVAHDDVVVRPWPVGLLPDGAGVDEPVGRVVVAAVFAGEPFVDTRLAPDGL